MIRKETENIKRVRMLLRVSSNGQLDADGDLSTQRSIVSDYIQQHECEGWRCDGKEYFEPGVSGYKNSVADRSALQEAYRDAVNGEYVLLVVYKDNRIGRRMWEIKIRNEIAVMNDKIPEAATGSYTIPLEKLMSVIKEHEIREQAQLDRVNQIKAELEHSAVSMSEWKEIHQKLPTWKEIFLTADVSRKRVLVNKLIERIDIRKDNINIRFKIDLNEFLQSRMSMGSGVQKSGIQFRYYKQHRLRPGLRIWTANL